MTEETMPVAPEQSEPKTEVAPSAPVVEPEADASPADEKSVLLARAKLMGLRVSNNIGLETLRKKITNALKAGEEGETKEVEKPSPTPTLPTAAPAQFKPSLNVPPEMAKNARPRGPETHQQIRDRLVREKMKLVRLRITNLDPKKKDLPGEIFTIANKYIGTVRKFIPFGEATENGYHVPYCIYQMLKARKFLHIRVVKSKNGRGDHIETSYVPEFSLEVLPQLTPKELKELARMQAAKKGGGED